jgi:hypothetical protein
MTPITMAVTATEKSRITAWLETNNNSLTINIEQERVLHEIGDTEDSVPNSDDAKVSRSSHRGNGADLWVALPSDIMNMVAEFAAIPAIIALSIACKGLYASATTAATSILTDLRFLDGRFPTIAALHNIFGLPGASKSILPAFHYAVKPACTKTFMSNLLGLLGVTPAPVASSSASATTTAAVASPSASATTTAATAEAPIAAAARAVTMRTATAVAASTAPVGAPLQAPTAALAVQTPTALSTGSRLRSLDFCTLLCEGARSRVVNHADVILAALAKVPLPRLETVNLLTIPVKSQDLLALQLAAPNVRECFLSEHAMLRQENMQFHRMWPQLRRLSMANLDPAVAHTVLSDEMMMYVAELHALEELSIAGGRVGATGCAHLKTGACRDSLRLLNLSRCPINQEAVEHLASMPNLISLTARDCSLLFSADTDAITLGRVLGAFPQLQLLDIANSRLAGTSFVVGLKDARRDHPAKRSAEMGEQWLRVNTTGCPNLHTMHMLYPERIIVSQMDDRTFPTSDLVAHVNHYAFARLGRIAALANHSCAGELVRSSVIQYLDRLQDSTPELRDHWRNQPIMAVVAQRQPYFPHSDHLPPSDRTRPQPNSAPVPRPGAKRSGAKRRDAPLEAQCDGGQPPCKRPYSRAASIVTGLVAIVSVTVGAYFLRRGYHI